MIHTNKLKARYRGDECGFTKVGLRGDQFCELNMNVVVDILELFGFDKAVMISFFCDREFVCDYCLLL